MYLGMILYITKIFHDIYVVIICVRYFLLYNIKLDYAELIMTLFFRKDSLHDEENEEDEHWNQISNDLDEEPLTRISGQSTKDTMHPM
jgi:hypothetical protein